MKLRSFSRFWAIILGTGLLVVVILGGWFVSLLRTAREVEETYNRQQQLLAEGAAAGVEGAFTDLQAELTAIAGLPEIRSLDVPAARAVLDAAFGELASLGVSEIGLLDESGVAQVFVVRPDLERVDYSWRTYFREAAALPAGADALVVELDSSVQESVFYFALPVFSVEANHFGGLLLVALTVDSIVERTLAPFEPPGGQILFVHDDLEVVWSSDANWTGANLLAARQGNFSELVDVMDSWLAAGPESGRYLFSPGEAAGQGDLIAYAPVRLGNELLAIVIRTPAEVARQASFTAFRGQQTVLLLSVALLLGGAVVGGLILNVETRRRFEAEEALRQSMREQAVLEERSRLAGDLHDSVTQSLYGIVLHADAARAKLAAGVDAEADAYLAEISEAGREGLAEMRMLIFELRPPVLVEEGLEAALEARLYAVERRMGLKADLRWAVAGRLPEDVEEGLYRIAREALNNILKHAEARHLVLSVTNEEGFVRMRIADDGAGFDRSAPSSGMGVQLMQERAQKIGGTARVESEPGKGATVIVEVKE